MKNNEIATVSKVCSSKQLKKLWAQCAQADLSGLNARYMVGRWLLAHVGKGRQDYGLQTLQKYATQLGVDRSELVRMRQCAVQYPSFEALRKRHPKVSSWFALRPLLVSKRAKGKSGGKGKVSTKASATKAFQSSIKQLRAVAKAVKAFRFADNRQREKLMQALMALSIKVSEVCNSKPQQQSLRLAA